MRSRSFVTAMLVVAALLLEVSSARADKKADDARKETARAAYAEGTKAYNLGDFPLAIKNYKDAYNALPEPVFLYNIAQAYRLANDFTQALFFYKSFLRNMATMRAMPGAPNQPEVERRIAEMEAALEQQKSAATRPPNGPVGPGDPPRGTEPGASPEPSSSPGPGDVKIPSPDAAAGTLPADTSSEPGPIDSGGKSKPIYKKWWFWAGIGAVAVGTVAIVAVSSGGGGEEAPDSHFGSYKIY